MSDQRMIETEELEIKLREDDKENEGSQTERQFGPFTLDLPSEWEAPRLGKVKKLFTRGRQPSYAEKGVPVINQECIYWDGWHFENLKHLDSNVAADWPEKYFPEKGDVILNSTGQGTLGRAQVYPDGEQRAVDSHVTILRTSERLNPHFHRYFLESHLGQALLYSMCVNGSTGQIELSKTRLDLMPVPLPPLDEQRKIASVLLTVDRAIQTTEAIIEKLKTIRLGLKRSLFSKGYFKHQSFKDSPIGRVPAAWSIKSADSLCDDITVGVVSGATDHYVEPKDGVPFIRSKDINETYIDKASLKYISRDFNNQKASSKLRAGDVVTVRTGQPGTSCVVPPEFQGANCFSLIISRPKETTNERFYSYYINSPRALKFIDAWKAGGVQDNFNIGVMKRLPVPVPPEEEQQKIVAVLDQVNGAITAEREKLQLLRRLKKGLMQDLLTGRVRTASKNIDVLDEVQAHG